MSRRMSGLISGTMRGTRYFTVSSQGDLVHQEDGSAARDVTVTFGGLETSTTRTVEREQLAEEFERARPRLRAVAYRMLGSLTEADDAVQEAWLRLDRSGAAIDDLRAWLVTVVGRICLDALRARTSRREDYAGTWLPEPVMQVDPQGDPERDSVLADSVGLALLVVLDSLTPAERLAFVLHDVFAVPFEEIATIVDRTPDAARQLASRARRRIGRTPREPDADLAVQREVVDAFLAAARSGDFEALIAILDPDVVLRFDGGGSGPLARPPIRGARAVAAEVGVRGRVFAGLAEPIIVNGGAGVLVRLTGRPVVAAITVIGGRIAEIDLIGDPAKLRGVV
jgi:RNA polymerase sigma-70 factor (ECF subfamily)